MSQDEFLRLLGMPGYAQTVGNALHSRVGGVQDCRQAGGRVSLGWALVPSPRAKPVFLSGKEPEADPVCLDLHHLLR